MVDTVKDVALGDIGKKLVQTDGVAVRPFWWSTAAVDVLRGQE